MCSMVLKPETVGFGAAPPKKWAFFAQKWPKNANIGPKTLFFGLGRSVQGPPTLFRTCLARKNISCMVWKPENTCFRAAPPEQWPFSGRKWPKFANFGQKKQCFRAWVLRSRPPYPIFKVLDTKKHVLHGIEAIKLVLQGRPTKKMGIFWPKLANFGQKSSVFGLGCSVFDSPTYFFGA